MTTKTRFYNTTVSKPRRVAPATGKLGILMPGMGAVASTFIAGVMASRRGLGKPIGSLTQLGRIRLGKRTEHRTPLLKDFVPLSDLKDLVFGGWDIFPDNMYQAALKAGVLEKAHLAPLKSELSKIKPMPAVFDPAYVSRITGPNVKKGRTKKELVNQLIADIAKFKKTNGCSRLVMVWCGSTEKYQTTADVHQSLAAFERGLEQNSPQIAPSQIYAYAALMSNVPYANGAPNLGVDTPALQELASKKKVPICGKDFKTGQTFMKTVLAPAFKARLLGLHGWFSANILGNRDGEVLDDPEAFKTKEESKLSALEFLLEPDQYPDLYSNYDHRVRINYYPPRGDNKEGWDNIDIFGWMGYPMQIKVNFLCRDSILAAPIVLDLALFLDLAHRAGMGGIQEWLSFYFKSPMAAPHLTPEHDLFIQLMKLKNTLRWLRGQELITHLGIEYYDSFKRSAAVLIALLLTLDASAEAVQWPWMVDSSTSTASNYTVSPSTSTVHHPQHHKTTSHQWQSRAQQFKGAVIKASPNPRVNEPRPSALPANAPEMQKLTQPETPPQTGVERFFAGAAKVMTYSWGDNIFVWLPAISTDPNTGPTLGILPVLVLADPKTHHIRHLMAPSYTYNSLFGQTGTARYYFYPTDASQLYTIASYSQHTNREFKVRYEDTDALSGLLYVRAVGHYSVDASPRFYGLGPQTSEGQETGYTAKEDVAAGTVGVNFSNSWRATIGGRFHRFTNEPNVIPGTADTATEFPTVTGLGEHNTVAFNSHLLWDTRDSPVTPERGASGEMFVEKTSVALGSYADYIRYGMEGKRFINYDNPGQVTVLRGLYEWENGPVLPFYELPSLGGRDTLRGFGDGRFYDRGRTVFSVEHRITVATLGLMGIQTDFQVAPFVDVGTVFPTLPQVEFKYLHPVVGGAFRAAVKPNVVGDVEIGVGNEGPAVFVDINYPY